MVHCPIVAQSFSPPLAAHRIFAVPHAFTFCLAILLTFLLHDSAEQQAQVIVLLFPV